jgi:hypothetical protein
VAYDETAMLGSKATPGFVLLKHPSTICLAA